MKKNVKQHITKKELIENHWSEIIDEISITFKLDVKEKKSLSNGKVAKLIGVLPLIAQCENPKRIALSHIGTYLIAMKGSKDTFNHDYTDDTEISTRLQQINHFVGGDPDILEKGMALLALNMIYGYKRDMDKDCGNNKYNPLNSGKWDYKSAIDEQIKIINNSSCTIVDEYFTIQHAIFSYWAY